MLKVKTKRNLKASNHVLIAKNLEQVLIRSPLSKFINSRNAQKQHVLS